MTQIDLLALLEEGVQNGRIAPHMAEYIAAEIQNAAANLASEDDQEARAGAPPADR